MKSVIIAMLIAAFFSASNNPDTILGQWNTKDNEGVVEIYKEGQKYFALGKGTLKHISSNGTISCILSLTIKFSLSAMNLSRVFPGTDDSIQIDIQQAVLKRENN